MIENILLDIFNRLLGPPLSPDCLLSHSVDRAFRRGFVSFAFIHSFIGFLIAIFNSTSEYLPSIRCFYENMYCLPCIR